MIPEFVEEVGAARCWNQYGQHKKSPAGVSELKSPNTPIPHTRTASVIYLRLFRKDSKRIKIPGISQILSSEKLTPISGS